MTNFPFIKIVVYIDNIVIYLSSVLFDFAKKIDPEKFVFFELISGSK